jgi:hypothetical protein
MLRMAFVRLVLTSSPALYECGSLNAEWWGERTPPMASRFAPALISFFERLWSVEHH